ncbi:unnamed protein product [Phytomonas sp. Hart1]|nr:unnamed protein product [Phytomonas sp. Hart1]|eukprot:CCW68432.1 unnamed protein product [Phytomonas sp. isolate Hart1]
MGTNRLKVMVDAFHPIVDVFSAAFDEPLSKFYPDGAGFDPCNFRNTPETLQALMKWLPDIAKQVVSRTCQDALGAPAVNSNAEFAQRDGAKREWGENTSEKAIYHGVMSFLAFVLAPVMANVPESALDSIKLEMACFHLLRLMHDVPREKLPFGGSKDTLLAEVWRKDRDIFLPPFSKNTNQGGIVDRLSFSRISLQLLLRALFLAFSHCWRRTTFLARQTSGSRTNRRQSSRAKRPSSSKIGRLKAVKSGDGDCEFKMENTDSWESIDPLLLFYPAEYYCRRLDAALALKNAFSGSLLSSSGDGNLFNIDDVGHARPRRKLRGDAKKKRNPTQGMRGAYARYGDSRRRFLRLRGPRFLAQGCRRERLFSEESSATTTSSSNEDESISSSCTSETEA